MLKAVPAVWRDDRPLRPRPGGKFKGSATPLAVMAGLDPAIYADLFAVRTRMPGSWREDALLPGHDAFVVSYAAAFGKR